MRKKFTSMRRLAFLPVFAGMMALAGCGGGMELEGPGFKIGGNSKRPEAKVPDRAPLILPPDRARLPQPQENTSVAVQQQNWPNDPDALKKSAEEEAVKKQKEYEDKGDWSKNAGIDEFEKLMDPLERQKGILSRGRGLGGLFGGENQSR